MLRGEPEVGSLQSVCIYYVEKGSNGEQGRNLTIVRGGEDGCQQGREQVIEESTEDAARAIPESLSCQFLYAAQRIGCFYKVKGLCFEAPDS